MKGGEEGEVGEYDGWQEGQVWNARKGTDESLPGRTGAQLAMMMPWVRGETKEGYGNLPRRLYDMVAAGGVFSTAGSKGNGFGTFEYAPNSRVEVGAAAVIGFNRLDRKIDRVGVVLGRSRGVECGCAWAAFALGERCFSFFSLAN